MYYKSKKSQKGFTLVELAIVLVIIGLIVSGVLVGQDLIKAAELRATLRQNQEFQVAVNTFIGKYNGIPGDINGSKYGLTGGCNGAVNLGNGNGLLTDVSGAILAHNGEISCFWANLTTSGKELIKGVFDGHEGAAAAGVNDTVGENMPKLKFGSTGWGVFNDGTINWFTTGVVGDGIASPPTNDAYFSTTDFLPLEAADLDSKIDDGVPNAGNFQARAAHATAINTAATSNAGANTTTCMNTTPTPNEYQFTATTKLCRVVIEMETF
jgi:prepilin-type N-terminal cleavage/methylation domain-containing protein